MKYLFFWLALLSNRMAVNIPQGKKMYLFYYILRPKYKNAVLLPSLGNSLSGNFMNLVAFSDL